MVLAHCQDSPVYAAVRVHHSPRDCVANLRCHREGIRPRPQGHLTHLFLVGDPDANGFHGVVGPVVGIHHHHVGVIGVGVRRAFIVGGSHEGEHPGTADAEGSSVGSRQAPGSVGRVRACGAVGGHHAHAVLGVIDVTWARYHQPTSYDLRGFVHVGDLDGHVDGGHFAVGVGGGDRHHVGRPVFVVQLGAGLQRDLATSHVSSVPSSLVILNKAISGPLRV